MEAPSERFVENERYLKSVPRPSDTERHALKLKIIQKGQLIPITVNSKMVILDGYTRHGIMEEMGLSVKYIIMHFETEQEEYEFVIETNVMRRQLTQFQRIETMYEMLKHERELRRVKNGMNYTDILSSIKRGNVVTNDIVKDLEFTRTYVSRILKDMDDKYYINHKTTMKKHSHGHSKEYVYSVMPKGEERLYKEKEANRMTKININDIIGVHDLTIKKAMHIIENCKDKVILDQLRLGKIGIGTVHFNIITRKSKKGEIHKPVWGKNAKIKCPSCNHIAVKKEFEVV